MTQQEFKALQVAQRASMAKLEGMESAVNAYQSQQLGYSRSRGKLQHEIRELSIKMRDAIIAGFRPEGV